VCLGNKDFIKANTDRLLDEHGLALYQCRLCAHKSRLSSNLAKHIEALHMKSEGVLCPHCQKIFNSRNSLQSHVSRQHRRMGEDDVMFLV
jgi:uncharacterized C2H2 Zn-finger protein